MLAEEPPTKSAPHYGQATAESGAFSYDDHYYDHEDIDLEDEIARLEEEPADSCAYN